jgi:pimeloyl-ACP methyl ester carboxylesterase
MTVTLSNMARSSSVADTGRKKRTWPLLRWRWFVGRFLLVFVAAAGLLIAPARARAAVTLAPCGKPVAALQCGRVLVPLDRTGTTPGTISLHVEVLPSEGPSRGVMFLIAGGPGQGSAHSFDLGQATEAQFYRFLFPDYTLVAFDNRGTGQSGLIKCPEIQNTVSTAVEQLANLTRVCADEIGPTRQFYATRDHAEDIESVRTALGYGKIGLYGVSYGTKLALAYALAHPAAVARIVLDSVVPAALPDPYDRDVTQAMPQTLRELCGGGRCRGITSNLAADVTSLANKLEAKPATGKIIAPGGAVITKHMNGEDLLGLIIDSDLNPGLESSLPAAIHAGRAGYMRPLLRLLDLDVRGSHLSAEDLSFGLNVATTCLDGMFPWAPSTPPSGRAAVLSAAVAALPAGSFGPFGKWAARLGSAFYCDAWPSPAGHTPLGPGPLPNVPVLTFSGGLDFRTPTSGARAVTNLFPQGRLVVVPGTGHNVLNQTLQSSCPFDALRGWLSGLPVPSSCPRVPAIENPTAVLPRVSPKKSAHATALDAAKSVREGEATWLQLLFSGLSSASGLYGGRVGFTTGGFKLTNYAIVPGMRVTGTATLVGGKAPFALKGSIKVSGPAAASGSLRIAQGRLSGKLGGRHVSAKL